MNNYENIKLTIDNSLAKIYLDRPEKLNAYTPDMGDEIIDAFNNKGNAVKKREETHKMADANRAFSHFRW